MDKNRLNTAPVNASAPKPLSSCCNAPVRINTSIAEPVNCTCTSCGKPCTVNPSAVEEIPELPKAVQTAIEIKSRNHTDNLVIFGAIQNKHHSEVKRLVTEEMKELCEWLIKFYSITLSDSTLREVERKVEAKIGEYAIEKSRTMENSPYRFSCEGAIAALDDALAIIREEI